MVGWLCYHFFHACIVLCLDLFALHSLQGHSVGLLIGHGFFLLYGFWHCGGGLMGDFDRSFSFTPVGFFFGTFGLNSCLYTYRP